jgi:hypothetical protein
MIKTKAPVKKTKLKEKKESELQGKEMKASILISQEYEAEELKALYVSKNYKSALKICDKLLQINKDDPTILYIQGNCLMFLDELFLAIEVFSVGISKHNSDFPDIQFKDVLILRHLS